MRIPKYLSPSGYQTFKNDPIRYFVQYLADELEPRMEQTIHMAMGSAFDAFVKSQITKDLQIKDAFDCRQLYEEQVHRKYWDELWDKAGFLLNMYKSCGAYGLIVADMGFANIEPRFEFGVEANILGVPCFGKPDAFYINRYDTPVILDWKVNSFLSAENKKKKFYVLDHQLGVPHRFAIINLDQDLPICVNHGLEETDEGWAFQQFVYAMGLGSKIGDRFITSIDQATGTGCFYTYRACLSKTFQIKAAKDLKRAWEQITSGYIFENLGLTREESDTLVRKLGGPERDCYV